MNRKKELRTSVTIFDGAGAFEKVVITRLIKNIYNSSSIVPNHR